MDFLYFLSSLRASPPTAKKFINRVLKAELLTAAPEFAALGALLRIYLLYSD